VIRKLCVGVGEEQICQSQTTTQIWKLVLPAIKLIVEIVGYEALDEAFEKSIDACQIKFGLLLLNLVTLVIPGGHLFQFVAEVFN